jgi:ubiquinone/menaquinone biosynthesis C-methylase UbiE
MVLHRRRALSSALGHLMAGQLSELQRLQLQSRVWEPAGARLLQRLGDGSGRRVLDAGCGCLGWLRILSRWVGDAGFVTGSDNAVEMLEHARRLVSDEGLHNVEVVEDNIFASALPERASDLVHARFQLAPLGRMVEQLQAYQRLVAPGGLLVLEDPDTRSWGYSPLAPALERLIGLVLDAFRAGGGDFDAGRREFQLLLDAGLQPWLWSQVTPSCGCLCSSARRCGPGSPGMRRGVTTRHRSESGSSG